MLFRALLPGARRWQSGGSLFELVNHDLPTASRGFTEKQMEMDRKMAARLKAVTRTVSRRTGWQRSDRYQLAMEIMEIVQQGKKRNMMGYGAYNAALSGLGALRELELMKRVLRMMDTQPTQVTWYVLAAAYLVAGDEDRALEAYECSLRHGFAPNRDMYAIRLRVAARRGDVDTCLMVLESMRALKQPPQPLQPQHVLETAQCSSSPAQLQEVFDRYADIIPEGDERRRDALMEWHFKAVKRLHSTDRHGTTAAVAALDAVYEAEKASRGVLSARAYTAVITARKLVQDYDGALRAWDDGVAAGAVPDTPLCGATLAVCLQAVKSAHDEYFTKAEEVFSYCDAHGALDHFIPWAMLMKVYGQTRCAARAELLMATIVRRCPRNQHARGVVVAYEAATRRRWRPERRVPVDVSAARLALPEAPRPPRGTDAVVDDLAEAWRSAGPRKRGFRAADPTPTFRRYKPQ